jgi:hypothetical protein
MKRCAKGLGVGGSYKTRLLGGDIVLSQGLGRVLVQRPVSGGCANVQYQFLSSTGVCEYWSVS